MHLPSWKWAWLPVVLLIAGKTAQVGGRNHLDLARTDYRLTRLPFFGGGVAHLLRYLNPLSPNSSPERGRISELRSDLDPNYVSYRGAQLWKLNFNATRDSSMEEREPGEEEEEQQQVEPEERQVLASPGAQFNEVVALFALTFVALIASVLGQKLLLWRSVSVPEISGISGLPLALLTLNGSELYESTFEGLQWLSPVDLRRFDVLSPGSSFQINRRYRNGSQVQRYYGFQLWKIHETRLELPELRAFWRHFGSEVWNINQDGIDILIEQRNVADAKKFMDKVGFSYNIMIDDIEAAIDETYVEVPAVEHPLDSVRNNSLPWMERPGSLMTWRRYHDHADIQQFLQNLLETYSENVELIQIGVTRNKRPLEVIRVSNGNPDNWAVFVDAGLQARDWLSPAALTYAISKLTHLWARPRAQGQGQRQSRADKAMRRIDWYFLPLANPDGYQYSRHTDRLWTKNRGYDTESGCYGVNLDRNFQYGWGGIGSTSNPCKNLYRGAESFSEPESRALRSFLSGMREYLGAYVSLSGYGQTITYPWGDADYVTENQRDLKQTARSAVLALRRLNHAEYSYGTSYNQKLARPGNSADWVQDRIEPQLVFNMFLKDQGRYGYLLPPHYIVESGEEVFEFLRTIAQQLE
ncbi:zinc carboxypeptidase A 1 isoform X1 [Drosophila biarmipes]|uniref:zinc carboxypeptidase A 1 isoform X1 n=1 Tax=Drosophila biarmipes TaxID=125945 RepID=UPI0007E7A147|nr:zinc carboxypeptidase A 1 isoform X1 [Drosophila biarmipes]